MLEALLEFKTGIQHNCKKKNTVDDETHASRVYYSNRTPTVVRVRTRSPFKVILMVKMINRTVNKESSGQFLALQKRSHRCKSGAEVNHYEKKFSKSKHCGVDW